MMNYEEWIEKIEEKDDVKKCIDSILSFSNVEKYSSVFQNCGLYAVGSSLKKDDPNDIDITLVGLDYRMVFEYDLCHLEYPEALIKEGIFVLGEDLDGCPDDHIEYNGQTYQYGKDYDSFSAFDFIRPSRFTDSLFGHLEKQCGGRKTSIQDNEANPFFRYQTAFGDYLASKAQFGSIDFIIHGENLLVPFWKMHQKREDLPFIPIYEWKNSNIQDLSARKIPKQIRFPDYIDLYGKERSTIFRSDFQW